MDFIIKIFWLFIPAGVANMSPVLFRWVPFGAGAVDFGKKIKNKPILGPHKTFRGFLAGIISAILVVYVQTIIYPLTTSLSLINYSETNALKLGFLLGTGALVGDAIKSFFKRRIGVPPGKPWVPFDQIDWIVGALIAVNLIIKIDYKSALAAIILFGLMHPIVNLIGYFLKVKKNKF